MGGDSKESINFDLLKTAKEKLKGIPNLTINENLENSNVMVVMTDFKSYIQLIAVCIDEIKAKVYTLSGFFCDYTLVDLTELVDIINKLREKFQLKLNMEKFEADKKAIEEKIKEIESEKKKFAEEIQAFELEKSKLKSDKSKLEQEIKLQATEKKKLDELGETLKKERDSKSQVIEKKNIATHCLSELTDSIITKFNKIAWPESKFTQTIINSKHLMNNQSLAVEDRAIYVSIPDCLNRICIMDYSNYARLMYEIYRNETYTTCFLSVPINIWDFDTIFFLVREFQKIKNFTEKEKKELSYCDSSNNSLGINYLFQWQESGTKKKPIEAKLNYGLNDYLAQVILVCQKVYLEYDVQFEENKDIKIFCSNGLYFQLEKINYSSGTQYHLVLLDINNSIIARFSGLYLLNTAIKIQEFLTFALKAAESI